MYINETFELFLFRKDVHVLDWKVFRRVTLLTTNKKYFPEEARTSGHVIESWKTFDPRSAGNFVETWHQSGGYLKCDQWISMNCSYIKWDLCRPTQSFFLKEDIQHLEIGDRCQGLSGFHIVVSWIMPLKAPWALPGSYQNRFSLAFCLIFWVW